MKNLFLIFLITNFLVGCGYNSIYSENKNTNFEILSLEIKGDRDINLQIEKKLKQYIGEENKKKFEIVINTYYSKNPISKDKTGKITGYKLIVELDLEFKILDEIQKVSISETFNMENFNDKFEEKKYEKEIKENLSNLMLNKIIPYLTNFE